jgi:hypothetical protein
MQTEDQKPITIKVGMSMRKTIKTWAKPETAHKGKEMTSQIR